MKIVLKVNGRESMLDFTIESAVAPANVWIIGSRYSHNAFDMVKVVSLMEAKTMMDGAVQNAEVARVANGDQNGCSYIVLKFNGTTPGYWEQPVSSLSMPWPFYLVDMDELKSTPGYEGCVTATDVAKRFLDDMQVRSFDQLRIRTERD